DRFNYDARQTAYVLVLMAVIMVAIQGGMIKRLVMRFGEKLLLSAGGVLMAVAFFFVPPSHAVGLLLIPLAVSAVGRGIGQPSLMSLVSRGGDEKIRGSGLGTVQSSASLARVLGPLIAGILYDRGQALPFFLAGALLILVFALSLDIPIDDARQITTDEIAHAEMDLST